MVIPTPRSTSRTALVFALIVVCAGGCVYLRDNFRVVDENRMYRSGQMGSSRLASVIYEHQIKTVVNLRGATPDEAWYGEEKAVCDASGVQHADFDWSMKRLPSPESLQRFVGILKESPGPVLVHCQGGTHRSGVGAAVYRLLNGATTDEAREEFTIFFNDAPIGELLTLYHESALPFDRWVVEEYPALYEAAQEERRAAE